MVSKLALILSLLSATDLPRGGTGPAPTEDSSFPDSLPWGLRELPREGGLPGEELEGVALLFVLLLLFLVCTGVAILLPPPVASDTESRDLLRTPPMLARESS